MNNNFWGKEGKTIKFETTPFLLFDEIETDFSTMLEFNGVNEIKGGWRINQINNEICILELFSSNFNELFTYQIYDVNQNSFKGEGFNFKGEKIVINLNKE